jgi:hypothetical protein
MTNVLCRLRPKQSSGLCTIGMCIAGLNATLTLPQQQLFAVGEPYGRLAEITSEEGDTVL